MVVSPTFTLDECGAYVFISSLDKSISICYYVARTQVEEFILDIFNLQMTENEIRQVSTLGLAHIGDAVFELMVRSWLCSNGKLTSKGLHSATVRYVAATAQAKAVEKISDHLTAEETAVYKRGRNARVNSVPQRADISEYHAATGLETLFGWLYLLGMRDRLNEIFMIIMEDSADAS